MKKEVPKAKFRVGQFDYCPRENHNIKKDLFSIDHYLVNRETGEVIEPDFTCWCFMSKIDVQNYISLSFPKRRMSYRPLSSDDLRKLARANTA